MMRVPFIHSGSPEARKRRRIERQLRALHAMQSHMKTWEIVCAVLAIPGLALLCLLIAWKLHWVSGSPMLSVAGAIGISAVIWWLGRRSFGLAALIVYALILLLLALLFEEVPDVSLDFPSGSDDPPRKEKTARALKLERAIAKREAILRSLQGKG